jgi:hypothetical protein
MWTTKILAGALVASALTVSQANATVLYNAVTDFSLASNPNGAWSYGYGTAGTSFTAMQNSFTGGFIGNPNFRYWQSSAPVAHTPLVAANTGGTTISFSTLISPNDVLLIHPGNQTDVIVRWTAPSAGYYQYSGLFQLLDRSPSGVIAQVFTNNLLTFSANLTGPGANTGTLTPGQSVAFGGAANLNAGDTLLFAVNRQGNFSNDSTGLKVNISVPEPSTIALIAMALLSMFGFGMMRRRADA